MDEPGRKAHLSEVEVLRASVLHGVLGPQNSGGIFDEGGVVCCVLRIDNFIQDIIP